MIIIGDNKKIKYGQEIYVWDDSSNEIIKRKFHSYEIGGGVNVIMRDEQIWHYWNYSIEYPTIEQMDITKNKNNRFIKNEEIPLQNYIYNIDKVPSSYIEYCEKNQNYFNSKIDLELPDELYEFVNEMAEKNNISLNTYMNYALLKMVITEKMKSNNKYDIGMLYFDLELYTEEEISKLIENNIILLFDEKANEKAVMLPSEEYKKLKNMEKLYTSKVINDNITTKIFMKINQTGDLNYFTSNHSNKEDAESQKKIKENNIDSLDYSEDLNYYEMLLENLEKIQS